MTIIFDLDDVLSNLRESLYQVMHKATGIDKHWRDWEHYDLGRHFSIDSDALNAILMEQRALENCVPEPGAAAATRHLSAQGFELSIVTARAWHPQAFELTQTWLQTHAITFHELRVVPLGSNKMDVLKEHRDIVLAIDDHPRNIQHYQQAGVSTLMVDRPWNAHYHATERIFSLQPVLDYTADWLKQ